MPYDKICIGTGAIPYSIATHPRVLSLRDSDSVRSLLDRIAEARRVVIVGNGGPPRPPPHPTDLWSSPCHLPQSARPPPPRPAHHSCTQRARGLCGALAIRGDLAPRRRGVRRAKREFAVRGGIAVRSEFAVRSESSPWILARDLRTERKIAPAVMAAARFQPGPSEALPVRPGPGRIVRPSPTHRGA